MTVFVRKVQRKGREPFIEYDIKGTYPDGETYRERRKSSLPSISATERWAEQRERKIIERWLEDQEKDHKSPSLQSAYDAYMRRSETKRNAAGTLEWKRIMWKHISEKIGATTPLDKITPAMIDCLVDGVGGKEKSVNNVLDVFLGICRNAQREGRIVHLPIVDKLKVPEAPPKHLVYDAFEQYLEAGRELEREGIWQPLAVGLLGGSCGLRRGEMLGLHLRNINFDERKIVVEFGWYKGKIIPTKGKRFRVVGLSDETVEVLERNKHAIGQLLFYHQRRGWPIVPATPHMIYKWFDMACERAGLTVEGKVHVLRHTFGTHHAEAGTDMHRLQSLLGHADQRTTEIYARIAASAALEATSKLDAHRAKKISAARGRANSGRLLGAKR